MITEARDTLGSFRFRTLKIVDIGCSPTLATRAEGTAGCPAMAAVPAGPASGPGPGGGGGPASAGGSGAMPGVKSGGPWQRAQRDGARTGRARRERYRGAGHIRWQLTRDGRGTEHPA